MNKPYIPHRWTTGEPIIITKLKNFDNRLVKVNTELQDIEKIYNKIAISAKSNTKQIYFIEDEKLIMKNLNNLINNIDDSIITFSFLDKDNNLLDYCNEVPTNFSLLIGS